MFGMNESEINPSGYSALNLAYIGDGVFELMTRNRILLKGNRPVNDLHKEAKKYVSAISQAKMYMKIFEVGTDEEKAILKRGRNAKSFTSAKNASISDYRHSTGLEALFGYLYLKKDYTRLSEIYEICVDVIG